MDRGIDHLVLTVNDLDRTRDAYAAFGFTTTPRATHPFGTGNSLVQMQGNFLELLTIVDESKFGTPVPGQFGFGAFNQSFLARREGMSMLVFEGHGVDSDHADFVAKGLKTYEPFHFERQATLPNGEKATVGFSLAFVTDPSMPEAAFFTCQQHAPQYFWKPEYQRHDNGAVAVTETVMVAEDPAALAGLLGALQGEESVSETATELRAKTARGDVTVLTPTAFGARFGSASPGPDSPHFAAFRVAVEDIPRTKTVLTGNGVPFRDADGNVQIGAEAAFGVTIEFAPKDGPADPR